MKKLFKLFSVVFSLLLIITLAACSGGTFSKTIIEQRAVVTIEDNTLFVVAKHKENQSSVQQALEVKATTAEVTFKTLDSESRELSTAYIYLKKDEASKNKDYAKILSTTKDESGYDVQKDEPYLKGELAFKFSIDLVEFYNQVKAEDKTVFDSKIPLEIVVTLRKGTDKVAANASYGGEKFIKATIEGETVNFNEVERVTAKFTYAKTAVYTTDAFIGYTLNQYSSKDYTENGIGLTKTSNDWVLNGNVITGNILDYVFNKEDNKNADGTYKTTFEFTR